MSVPSPAATILTSPPTPTNNNTAQFTFTGAAGTVSYQCQLYGSTTADGNYTACTSPKYAMLSENAVTTGWNAV